MQGLNRRIIVSVTNDISTDNRVHKICNTLIDMGFDVVLVGRKLPYSLLPGKRKYKIHRFRLLFNKGPLFYICFNFRLFIFLFFSRVDVLLSNDLDTLPAYFLVSLVKHKPLIYDSHEYFTEVPELINRPKVKKVWELLEKFLVPRVEVAYTVCNSIASAYMEKYNIPFKVVRNVPYAKPELQCSKRPDKDPYMIYQGALNKGRGLEHIISAMNYIEGIKLLIAGDGDLADDLKEQVVREKLEEKVEFLGRLPYEELMTITAGASLGLSIEEDMGLNYRYALPNKLFDYIQARVPVVVSNRPEMAAIVRSYNIGEVIDNLSPTAIADKIKAILNDQKKLTVWKFNLEKAAIELIWENEEAVIQNIFKKYI